MTNSELQYTKTVHSSSGWTKQTLRGDYCNIFILHKAIMRSTFDGIITFAGTQVYSGDQETALAPEQTD